MRSKRICALAEAALVTALIRTAHADPSTARLRMNADELPLGTTEGWKIDAKLAVLPNGAREGAKVPSAWATTEPDDVIPSSRCVDDRRGDVQAIYGGTTNTTRIFESGGKAYVDHATVEVKDGVVHVTAATRTPLARVTDDLRAYRTKDAVVLVVALDEGVFDRAVFYGCAIREMHVASPAGTTTFVSSAEEADRVMREMKGDRKNELPKWIGTELTVRASVSRSSADPGPMLRLIVTRGRERSP